MKIELLGKEYTIPEGQAVLVFGNFRTGSNAICESIQRQTGLPYLDEAFGLIFQGKEYMENYQGKPCIIKLMMNHVARIPDDVRSQLFANSFKVGIYRRDLIAQAISLSTAIKKDHWIVTRDNVADYEPTTLIALPGNDFRAMHLIELHNEYKTYRPHLDVELVYEDAAEEFNKTSHVVTPKHPKYNDYYEIAKQTLISKNLPTTND